MNTGGREEESKAGPRAAARPWSGPAARVRQLLARMEKSQKALDRLIHATDTHVAALSPRLALLEATPFGGLPDIELERAASDAPAPRAKTAFDLPELPAPRRAAATLPAALDATTTLPADAPARRLKPAKRALPALRLRAARAHDTSSSTRKPRNPPVPLSLNAPSERVRTESVAESTVEAKNAQTQPVVSGRIVHLGELVERVLRERGKSAQTLPNTRAVRLTERAEYKSGTRSGHTQTIVEPTRTVPGADAPAPSLLPRHGTFRLARTAARDAHKRRWAADIPLRDALPVSPDEVLDLAGPFRRVEQVFYFDPLEPRSAADDADDALTERINDVLREQARRQGVDLT